MAMLFSRRGARRPWLAPALLIALLLSLSGCGGTSAAGDGTPAGTIPPGSPTPTPPAPGASASAGWDSFMFAGQTGVAQYIVLNVNLNGKTEALTQYVLPQVQFGTIAPDGKNLLYQQEVNGHTRFYTVLAPRPSTGFFYEQKNDSATLIGNAIWQSDSRHVLILNPLSGIWSIDARSGQARKVLTLPVSGQGWTLDGIQALLAYRDGYVYFQGAGGGECMGAICRVQIGTSHPTLTRYSARQTGSSDFLLSPDGQTIYYCNTGPAGAAGLYAVNSDGSHSRLLRQSTTGSDCGQASPVGFAADNGLVAVGQINGHFEVSELGPTPRQDRVLLADAAPGAVSLCTSGNKLAFSKNVCPQDVALAPYAHALVVQGLLPDGQTQLWGTDLTTGKQQVLHPLTSNPRPGQLLGWDQLPVCASGRC